MNPWLKRPMERWLRPLIQQKSLNFLAERFRICAVLVDHFTAIQVSSRSLFGCLAR